MQYRWGPKVSQQGVLGTHRASTAMLRARSWDSMSVWSRHTLSSSLVRDSRGLSTLSEVSAAAWVAGLHQHKQQVYWVMEAEQGGRQAHNWCKLVQLDVTTCICQPHIHSQNCIQAPWLHPCGLDSCTWAPGCFRTHL